MSRPAPATAPTADDLYKKMSVAATVFAVIFEAGYLATSAAPYPNLRSWEWFFRFLRNAE